MWCAQYEKQPHKVWGYITTIRALKTEKKVKKSKFWAICVRWNWVNEQQLEDQNKNKKEIKILGISWN